MFSVLNTLHRWPLWLRGGLSAAALGAAFVIQFPLEREVPGEPFLMFFLIVVGCTVGFGQTVGFFTAALSALLCVFFFEPGDSLRIKDAADLVQIELYAVLAGLTVFGLHRLRKMMDAVYEANRLLAESERQKQVLLSELAHRVANNFATIAALIQQRSVGVADPQAKSALAEATEQVRVMARIHNRLKAGNENIVLDSRRFMQELCDDVRVSLASNRPISIACTAASFPLSAIEAVPIGLLVNELVTNAVKYAFPNGRKGSIRVLLEQTGNGLRLSVIDDGVGMQSAVQGTGLGHRLSRALAQQLGSRLEVESSGNGTAVSLLFTPSAARAAASRPQGAALH